MKLMIPRLMIAAPKSGSGKTLLTCAFLGALKKRKKDVIAFKCGPDYIDPMFHRKVQEIPAENLDTWFSGEEGTRALFADLARGHEIAVMEGVMGLFDGLGGVRPEGSAYHLASVTETPILLLVDVHGMGRSMIPMIKGFLDYDRSCQEEKNPGEESRGRIAGILLNRISGSFFETMKPILEEELAVPVVGYFPNCKDLHLESRHLGLQLPDEREDLKEQLRLAADQFEATVDVDLLLSLAGEAAGYESKEPADEHEPKQRSLRLAVARDEAFCFYYQANIRLLEKMGVEMVYFSPLHDPALPDQVHGILLGGGYPELYGEKLAANKSMRESIYKALEQGMPSLAECGGFMYLHDSLTDPDGNTYPMVGAIAAKAEYKGKLVRFGYVEISSDKYGKTKGHEFHYYDSSSNGDSCLASKPVGGKSWRCIHEDEQHVWGFPHLYYPSNPAFVESFVEKMRNYADQSTYVDQRESVDQSDLQTGIILLSFGTTYEETRKKNIHALTALVKETNPELPVIEAFSSTRVRRVLKERDGLVIFGIEEAMEQMRALGVRHLVVSPTHILGGYEYEKCRKLVEERTGWFESVSFGSPLLGGEEDYRIVAKAFWDGFSNSLGAESDSGLGGKEKPVILMGHGSSHKADESYRRLEAGLQKYGGSEIYIATVEGEKTIQDVIEKLTRDGVKAASEVYLTPFMLVAGDHARHDMAGEEDSFAAALKEAGYEPVCILKGIGEYPEIQEIYIRKIKEQL